MDEPPEALIGDAEAEAGPCVSEELQAASSKITASAIAIRPVKILLLSPQGTGGR